MLHREAEKFLVPSRCLAASLVAAFDTDGSFVKLNFVAFAKHDRELAAFARAPNAVAGFPRKSCQSTLG